MEVTVHGFEQLELQELDSTVFFSFFEFQMFRLKVNVSSFERLQRVFNHQSSVMFTKKVPFPFPAAQSYHFFSDSWQLESCNTCRQIYRFVANQFKELGEETSEAASVFWKLAGLEEICGSSMIMIILDIIWPLIFFSAAAGSFLRTCSILNLERTPLC